ncbi:MAG: hypothetical protein A2Y64_04170 [Candidatus Coatesbacteria bacterium RBG_13_66_14]|uniref:Uncharacterized protein n=1 Tax=Candidatus Coatesbacteria bacterium RBG_13_66_14 TaxID=1817816 RepID=A0A1F5FHC4_9BACT|nr:MAG: hypothetical protein A2Y64_04170 [Candidatus Coatesbacteria bacterium RBG_13_66_14]
MRKIVVLTLVLATAFLFSCTTTTGGDGDGGGLTEWAFDWALDKAKSWAEDHWGGWESAAHVFMYQCIWADDKCMLGRPQADSYWDIFFQNEDDAAYGVVVDSDGDCNGDDYGDWGAEVDEIASYSNAKLEEMMQFALYETDNFWDLFGADPDDYNWAVEVRTDWYGEFEDADNMFFVFFYEDRGDEFAWAVIAIDADGDGDDYDWWYQVSYNRDTWFTGR